MEAIVAGERVRMGVTDFVGEYAIPNGNYTYELLYGPRSTNGGVEDIHGQLIYDQTALDREIDSVIDEEIAISILNEYYRDSSLTLKMDSGYYGSLKTICVHQQTHKSSNRDRNKSVSSTVVYAKVVCTVSSHRSSLEDSLKAFNDTFPLPIRIELQEQNGAFTVVSYQFPQKGSNYERDLKQIFSPSAIDETAAAEIEAATHNHLALKLM